MNRTADDREGQPCPKCGDPLEADGDDVICPTCGYTALNDASFDRIRDLPTRLTADR